MGPSGRHWMNVELTLHCFWIMDKACSSTLHMMTGYRSFVGSCQVYKDYQVEAWDATQQNIHQRLAPPLLLPLITGGGLRLLTPT